MFCLQDIVLHSRDSLRWLSLQLPTAVKYNYDSPLTHDPLNLGGCRSGPVTSSLCSLRPLTLGPSSGGESSTMEKTMRPSTAMMTSSAIRMPRQLRWLGVEATSSCKTPPGDGQKCTANFEKSLIKLKYNYGKLNLKIK